MNRFQMILLAGLVAVSMVLGACTPVGVAAGAGATAGVAAAREGGISGALTDARIRAAINDRWLRADIDMFRKLNLTVDTGRVLITGVVQKQQHRVEAVRLAWSVNGVTQVINEIKVADSQGIKGFVRDNWIVTQLRTKMLLDKDIQSINYSLDAVQGIVYLMGIAQSQGELDKVIAHARLTPYVRDVVSYVKMSGTGSASYTNTAPVVQEHAPSPPARLAPNLVSPTSSAGAVEQTPLGAASSSSRDALRRAAPIAEEPNF